MRTMFAYLVSPGSFRTVVGSDPVRYSITAVSDSRPLTDMKAPDAMPSISTMNLKTVKGSLRLAAGIAPA
jgi:hypothetical protein